MHYLCVVLNQLSLISNISISSVPTSSVRNTTYLSIYIEQMNNIPVAQILIMVTDHDCFPYCTD